MARKFLTAASQYLNHVGSPITDEPFSMACWFYALTSSATGVLMAIEDADGSPSHLLEAEDAGLEVEASSYDGTYSTADSTTSWAINEWHHATGVWAANADRRVYHNGGGKNTNVDSRNVTGLDNLGIGRRGGSDPANYFNGYIAEAAIWNIALTDDEVAILAKGYSPLFVHPQNLVAYWPLIRDEDQDRVGGYDLTPVNAPTIATHMPKVIYPVSSILSLERGICTTTITITATVTITVTAQQ